MSAVAPKAMFRMAVPPNEDVPCQLKLFVTVMLPVPCRAADKSRMATVTGPVRFTQPLGITAVSLAPGTTPQDHLDASVQLPVVPFQVPETACMLLGCTTTGVCSAIMMLVAEGITVVVTSAV